jgi:hypothetical protein
LGEGSKAAEEDGSGEKHLKDGGRKKEWFAALPRTSHGNPAASREKSEDLRCFAALCMGEDRNTPGRRQRS